MRYESCRSAPVPLLPENIEISLGGPPLVIAAKTDCRIQDSLATISAIDVRNLRSECGCHVILSF
jgi:hypothetical protein